MPSGPQDQVEMGKVSSSQPLMKPNMVASTKPAVPDSPRPWPPMRTFGSAVASLGVPLPFEPPRDPWDARPTPDGWKVPRNPSRTPVRPRDPFEVEEGTDDLGPLTVVSSLGGRIRALRLQWPEEFLEPAWSAHGAVFHDVLTRLPADVTIHVVAEGLGGPALQRLLREWGVGSERVHIHPLHLRSGPAQIYEPLTLWARDGAVLTRTVDGREVLLLPRTFRGDGQVDATLNRVVVQGTGAAPGLLGRVLPDLLVRRSQLSFEGGDVVASERAVLVGWESVARTMADLKLPREAVVERFAAQFGRPVQVVEPQPDFHVDLGFTFLSEDVIAVADPGDTLRRVDGLPEAVQATREKGVAERYDRAARRLEEAGYRVVRLPGLCGRGLSTPYYTYNNVLLESGRVYLPVYGAPMDEWARQVYRAHGYQVVDMPSAALSTKLWGAIRCATGEHREFTVSTTR